MAECKGCHGTGKCEKCKGKGYTIGTLGGQTPCSKCGGSGNCTVCDGKGKS